MASSLRPFWDVRVELRVSEAKNLGSRDQNDPLDPFCIVHVDDEEVARTSTQWRTLNPFFGETFHIALPHNFSVMGLSNKHAKLGLVYMTREDLFNTLKHPGKDRWYPLLKPVPAMEAQGEVFVELLVTMTPLGAKRLDVTVVKARDVFSKGSVGKYDTYFVIDLEGDARSSDRQAGAKQFELSTGILFGIKHFRLNEQACQNHLQSPFLMLQVCSASARSAVHLLMRKFSEKPGIFLGQANIPLSNLEYGLRHPRWYRLGPRMQDYEENTSGNGTIRVSAQLTHELIMPPSAYSPLFSYLQNSLSRPDVATTGWLGLLQSLLVDTSCASFLDRDHLASAIMQALHTQDAVDCLRALTQQQIANTDDSVTLFRSNTLASKCLDYFMKIIGLPYLHETLKEIIDEIFHEKKDCEIDPSKILTGNPANIVKRHAADLIRYLEKILQSIFSSVERCPRPMRVAFSNIRVAVGRNAALTSDADGQRTNASYTAVSGFIVLRFFAPAVLSPKLFGMREELADATTARTLTLLAKALQTAGNLGSADLTLKEPYMQPLGAVIDANVPRVKSFIDQLCNIDTQSTDIEERIPLESENDHVAIISAKLNVLEPGTKSFKKKLTTLSRNALLWQKSLKERPQHLFLRNVINLEVMDANVYDKKHVVQILLDDGRSLVLSFTSAEEMVTWLKLFREGLRGSEAFIRTACHSGVFKKGRWTCCAQMASDAAPCSKAHTALTLNSFSLAFSESERLHSFFAILVQLLPCLQSIKEEHRSDSQYPFQEVMDRLIECLRLLEIKHLLLQKPASQNDDIAHASRGGAQLFS
eukprot:gene10608-2730_t